MKKETNLEHYTEEIVTDVKYEIPMECAVAMFLRSKRCNQLSEVDKCEKCIRETIGWLLEEYQEPIVEE